MFLNYPIKYAAMPIKVDGMIIYIASKCYRIRILTVDTQDGKQNTTYEVVFPFQREFKTDFWKRNVPEIDGFERMNICSNSNIVSTIFDTFVEAKKEAKKNNTKEPYDESREYKQKKTHMEYVIDARTKQKNILKLYNILETRIEAGTQDLVVGAIPQEQTCITETSEKTNVEHRSLYRTIHAQKDTFFCVYHVTKSEYEEMKRQIKESGGLNKAFTKAIRSKINRCLLVNNPKKQITQISNFNPSMEGCYYLKKGDMYYDSEMISMQKEMASQKNHYECTIYTMEEMEDILKSYISHAENDKVNIGNQEYRRVLMLKDETDN